MKTQFCQKTDIQSNFRPYWKRTWATSDGFSQILSIWIQPYWTKVLVRSSFENKCMCSMWLNTRCWEYILCVTGNCFGDRVHPCWVPGTSRPWHRWHSPVQVARGSRRSLGSCEQAPQLHAGGLMSLRSSCVKTIQTCIWQHFKRTPE